MTIACCRLQIYKSFNGSLNIAFFLAIASHAIHSSHFVFIVVTMNVGHFGVEFAGVGNYLLAQSRIQNTSKYLGWSIFSKQLMAFK